MSGVVDQPSSQSGSSRVRIVSFRDGAGQVLDPADDGRVVGLKLSIRRSGASPVV